MSELQILQDSFATAIRSGKLAGFADELAAGAADTRRRFAIYRNNSFGSLTGALKAVFPVTAALGDERFFDYAAHHFIVQHPPREPRLSLYGEHLPRFLKSFPASREAPLLSEMAAFEWALASSLNRPEEGAATVAMLRADSLDGSKTCLRLQPNLSFVQTRWPLIGLWMHYSQRKRMPEMPLNREPSRVAIFRHDDDIEFMTLEPARYIFWRMLAKDRSLEAAAARALARDPLFDLVQETLLLFRAGLVTSVFTPLSYH